MSFLRAVTVIFLLLTAVSLSYSAVHYRQITCYLCLDSTQAAYVMPDSEHVVSEVILPDGWTEAYSIPVAKRGRYCDMIKYFAHGLCFRTYVDWTGIEYRNFLDEYSLQGNKLLKPKQNKYYYAFAIVVFLGILVFLYKRCDGTYEKRYDGERPETARPDIRD